MDPWFVDLFLMLSRLNDEFKIGVPKDVYIKSYSEHKDWEVISRGRGYPAQFSFGDHVLISGTEMNYVAEPSNTTAGVWDIKASYQATRLRLLTDLNKLEKIVEEYGFCVTLIATKYILFEVMDRVVVGGYAINDSYCAAFDAGMNFVELCKTAWEKHVPTLKLLGNLDRVYGENMKDKENETSFEEKAPIENVKRVKSESSVGKSSAFGKE